MSTTKKKKDDHGIELWEKVQQAMIDNEDQFNSRIFTLETGGLGLSFTVYSFIVSEMKLTLTWPAYAIWISFLVCIVLGMTSSATATFLTAKKEKETREKIERGEKIPEKVASNTIDNLNKTLLRIDWCAFVLLILTIVAATLYCFFLIKK